MIKKIIKFSSKSIALLTDTILPTLCLLCSKKKSMYPYPVCNRCKQDLIVSIHPVISSVKYIDTIWSCYEYTGIQKKLLWHFKYSGNTKTRLLIKHILEKLITHHSLFDPDIELILPVPIHKTKKRMRGYNQSEIISNMVSGLISKPSANGIINKNRNTSAQTYLTRAERINNLKGSIEAENKNIIKEKSILLIDDITTTGSTLNECAQVLLNAGAKKIYGFTLAKTPG